MAETVRCFWTEPTGRVRLALRRFVASDGEKCPLPLGFHNAKAPLRDDVERIGHDDDGARRYLASWDDAAPPHDDPRWPPACACGVAFRPTDERQVWQEQIYRRVDTGEEQPRDEFPPGAMFDAWWHHGIADWCGPDGRALTVRLPDGVEWQIDGPARGHVLHAWTRTGDPPLLTARPSIQTKDYHGFLTAGELVSC